MSTWIGVSGWSYEHWKGRFYPAGLPAGRRLAFYAERFGTVEVNSTFYGPPRAELLRRWAEATPPGFLFAVKASRLFTHERRLRAGAAELAHFFQALGALGGKLGPVLFQLPPAFPAAPELLAAFLERLPKSLRCAFEFRDPSWWTPEVEALLAARGAAFCVFDLRGRLSPLAVTADFAYVRLHGPGRRAYHGRYGPEALEAWARRIEAWGGAGRDVHLYFDNTEKAAAAEDAAWLRERLGIA